MSSNPISPNIPSSILDEIAHSVGAAEVRVGETLQSLWSGYGGIVAIELVGKVTQQAIIKLISPPETGSHPRGWNTDRSHERKLQSYVVETHWYEHYAALCNDQCRVPDVLATGQQGASRYIVLENLNAHFPAREMSLSVEEACVCLCWLAEFHALFLGVSPSGLWPVGTYWHLATRTDEFDVMPEGQLKSMATPLDNALNQCQYQTLVHGDAKVANFCFSNDLMSVAAVDFQYVGGGVGVKDVAYFLGSCIDENNLEKHESRLLDFYFERLVSAVSRKHNNKIAQEVERAWRDLYAIAWTDFYRFLSGWSPEHTKINAYTRKLAQSAFLQLT